MLTNVLVFAVTALSIILIEEYVGEYVENNTFLHKIYKERLTADPGYLTRIREKKWKKWHTLALNIAFNKAHAEFIQSYLKL